MIFEHHNYRDFLRHVFQERLQKNSAYSLRAMARQLGMSPSLLSEVHNGKKNLSHGKALEVAERLSLGEDEKHYFCELVRYETCKKPDVKLKVQAQLKVMNPRHPVADLNIDIFAAISQWYHIPILVMTDLHDFAMTPKNISRKIGITTVEASGALERLERLELLKRDETGRYRRAHNYSVFESKVAHEGLRNFHREMLLQAVTSLRTQSPKEKFVGSETFAVDPKVLPGAFALCRKFLSQSVAHANQSQKRSEVYHLNVQLFKVKEGAES